MTTTSLAPLLESLGETQKGLAPDQARYGADLAALANDIRVLSELSATQRGRREIPTDRPGFWARLPWVAFLDGIDFVPLLRPPSSDGSAALLRYRAGASGPYHFHAGNEHVVILSGSQRDKLGRYERGTVTFNETGSAHQVSSPEGCIVAIFWEKPVVFLAGG